MPSKRLAGRPDDPAPDHRIQLSSINVPQNNVVAGNRIAVTSATITER
jgi:hypothetical protein